MTRQFARGLLCYLCVVFQNVYSDSPQPVAFVHLLYIMHLYRIYSIFPNLFLKYFRILSACSLGIPADPLGIHKKLQKSLLLLNFAREKPEQNPEKFSIFKLFVKHFTKVVGNFIWLISIHLLHFLPYLCKNSQTSDS